MTVPDGSAPTLTPPALLPGKSYFRIGEVTELLGENDHTLRFWEQEFRVRVERSKCGQRIYSRKTVELLIRIRRLLRVELYTIAGAKRRLRTAERCAHCGKELGEPNG